MFFSVLSIVMMKNFGLVHVCCPPSRNDKLACFGLKRCSFAVCSVITLFLYKVLWVDGWQELPLVADIYEAILYPTLHNDCNLLYPYWYFSMVPLCPCISFIKNPLVSVQEGNRTEAAPISTNSTFGSQPGTKERKFCFYSNTKKKKKAFLIGDSSSESCLLSQTPSSVQGGAMSPEENTPLCRCL